VSAECRRCAEAPAAPATVGGEQVPTTGHWETGKAGRQHRPASQETCRRQRHLTAGRGVPMGRKAVLRWRAEVRCWRRGLRVWTRHLPTKGNRNCRFGRGGVRLSSSARTSLVRRRRRDIACVSHPTRSRPKEAVNVGFQW